MSKFVKLIKDNAKVAEVIKTVASAAGMDMTKIEDRLTISDKATGKLGSRLVLLNQIMLSPVQTISDENWRDRQSRIGEARPVALVALRGAIYTDTDLKAMKEAGEPMVDTSAFDLVKDELGHHSFMTDEGEIVQAKQPDNEMVEEAINYLGSLLGIQTKCKFDTLAWEASETKVIEKLKEMQKAKADKIATHKAKQQTVTEAA